MEYQDKFLKCIDCGTDFVFTAGEQQFFHDKKFTNEPKRCKNCKDKRVAVLGAASRGTAGHGSASHGSSRGYSNARTETRTNCSRCGKETTVPFRPTQGRPVLCRECFQQGRQQVASAG
jgi:CxxC-x17-CxxC domain-containing protein